MRGERPLQFRPGPDGLRAVAGFLPAVVLGIAALLAPPCLESQADPESRSRNQPVAPFRIIGNLHYVGASDITSFLLATNRGLILLDGGYVETAPQIRDNIARLGFKLSDVKIILSSHAHFDHVGGLAQLKAWTGARLFASAGDAPLLEAGGHGDPLFGDTLPFPPVEVDHAGVVVERVVMAGHLQR